jgi:hypothetical protein
MNDNSTVLACVAERTTFVQQFHIRASDLGKVNITVSAEVDPSYPEECGPDILVHRRYEGWNFNSGNTAVGTPCNGTK